ncbi:PorP/SprF family type IX secretion system membrane protein [Tamlana fucoidanivorans]|uniref:Type IX secretion system membrane protein PorP/SprF n=1 Tax=Allotamlana fucoidanivorans TaxID=2583814 RepID=A0A5C4SQM5_9FLAO|nr:PorP/SprF family type IX secretion system membrane protein [Tamlana fucoidanivorans]TNJ46387.1 type IX secretion system membrane protein PorP/SprF [Tamlana fucoidanivorans]
MTKYILHIILFFCMVQNLFAQEDGVVAYHVPIRTSLKFNRQFINPTFSFVREQNKYISFYNKREWVQFDDAPQTYLFGYSGRFRENIGAGLSLFQQNYGVLNTFGANLNVAYNAALNRFNNLTFGLNVAFYKSGINEGKVVTNFPDPSLNNIPSNTVIAINPGINYGTDFVDFGLALNNVVAYNLTTSKIIEENPEQSLQVHAMYTGYMEGRGFFDESKFSALVRSEFKKNQTVISGIAMLTVPKGLWGQVGYSTFYGFSAGIGLNISSQIAIEYNFEKAIGDISVLGHSHDITLAYKFKNNNRYNYSGDDDEQALLIQDKKKYRRVVHTKPDPRKNKTATNTSVKEVNKKNVVTESGGAAVIPVHLGTETKDSKAEQEVLARQKAEEEKQAQIADAARIKEEELLKQQEAARQAEALARQKAEEEKQAQIAEAARIKEEELLKQQEAARQAEALARQKAEEEKQAQIAEAARIKEEELLKQQEAARQAEALALQKAEEEKQAQINTATETANKVEEPVLQGEGVEELKDITESANDTKDAQQELITQLIERIDVKQKDLIDLKEENDLSEQGIYQAPKAFKSVSAENAQIKAISLQIDQAINVQEEKINNLQELYNERLKKVRNKNDQVNMAFQEKIESLKNDQLEIIKTKKELLEKLDKINEATEVERKRRIKRALYDNEEDRYKKDRAALSRIKNNTALSETPLKASDFDSGEELNNIVIVKDVKHVNSGYYLVVAVHSDVNKRDAFIAKAVAAGETNIDFFYDVNTSKYYIYYQQYDNLDQAQRAHEAKGSQPYNAKMSIVKIEN